MFDCRSPLGTSMLRFIVFFASCDCLFHVTFMFQTLHGIACRIFFCCERFNRRKYGRGGLIYFAAWTFYSTGSRGACYDWLTGGATAGHAGRGEGGREEIRVGNGGEGEQPALAIDGQVHGRLDGVGHLGGVGVRLRLSDAVEGRRIGRVAAERRLHQVRRVELSGAGLTLFRSRCLFDTVWRVTKNDQRNGRV